MSAFPILSLLQSRDGDYSLEQEGGLTKRELFAAMVFQQFLHGAVLPPGFDASEQLKLAAQRSIECADALIAALEKTND